MVIRDERKVSFMVYSYFDEFIYPSKIKSVDLFLKHIINRDVNFSVKKNINEALKMIAFCGISFTYCKTLQFCRNFISQIENIAIFGGI